MCIRDRFSRDIKNRSSKLADKALWPKIDDEFESKVADLKRILVKKLMILTEGKVSHCLLYTSRCV